MKNKESLIRSISGVFIVVILLTFIYSHSITFDFCFLFTVGLFMAMEWGLITGASTNKNRWSIIGIFYISITLLPLLFLKTTVPDGSHLVMWLFILVWSTDTFAYIVGAKLGLHKHKISKISPNKSYEGLVGGTIASMIFCFLFANRFLSEYKYLLLLLTPIFSCLEQASDFTESYVKRKFNVKDSGDIIPGHGGFLDRFDGFLYITLLLIYILRWV